mmetsp:Transcript_34197/g.59854  ORF Transcript_34197/g.59854 Transcript_34197/m.59854 type:complete len:202 (+) Transcript_34197:649-1254(+)
MKSQRAQQSMQSVLQTPPAISNAQLPPEESLRVAAAPIVSRSIPLDVLAYLQALLVHPPHPHEPFPTVSSDLPVQAAALPPLSASPQPAFVQPATNPQLLPVFAGHLSSPPRLQCTAISNPCRKHRTRAPTPRLAWSKAVNQSLLHPPSRHLCSQSYFSTRNCSLQQNLGEQLRSPTPLSALAAAAAGPRPPPALPVPPPV